MKMIHLSVKDDYVDNVVMMLTGLKDVMIETIEVEDDLSVNKQDCLTTLKKIKTEGLANFKPITDIDEHIKDLQNAIA
ncbi:MAG: hypothetical protein PHU14_11275 [Methylovulum sp.]|nr:hypothetical protein [Methylovulum sp.]